MRRRLRSGPSLLRIVDRFAVFGILGFFGLCVLAARRAAAGCCRVVKVDGTTLSIVVQVCEPDAAGECGGLLFSGSLGVGEDEAVCTDSPTVVYREWDDLAGDFAPPVEARCEGGDVEI